MHVKTPVGDMCVLIDTRPELVSWWTSLRECNAATRMSELIHR